MYKLKTPPLLPGKSSPIFPLRCVALHYASKRLTLSFALGSTWPGDIENHFCQGAKMFNQSFRIGLPAPEW
jgi:hypothetical protein